MSNFRAAGNKVPHGNTGAVFNIKDEMEKHEEADGEEAKPLSFDGKQKNE